MTSRKPVLSILVAVATAAALLWVWTRFADIWTPSVMFYAGLVLLLAGLISLVVPLKFVGVRTRTRGALVALAGMAIGAAALIWPTAAAPRSANGSAELDRVMPEFDRSERHEIRVPASCELVRRAAEEVTFSDIRGFQTLMSIRTMRKVEVRPKPVLAAMTGPGANFTMLARTDGEFVAGNVGRPWKNERPAPIAGAEEFRSFAGPGYAKVAFNMLVEPAGPGSCKLSTETRVFATDETSRSAFTRYWRVIYPGSALIRVLWLDAIQRRLHS
jgi:hypothetical protein